MLSAKVKISKKGQIVIPKKFRDKLGTQVLDLEMGHNEIIIRPSKSIQSLGGILGKYGKRKTAIKEEEAWTEHVKEKFRTD